VPLAHSKLCLENRRVAAGMLLAEFKMPWRDLAETSARDRAFGAGEVNLSSNSELWSLYQICRRSCLGASPLGIGFRQEIPGGFEFRQKHSRRKSAVK